MIRIILAYFAIGLLLMTRYSWSEVIRYREEGNLSMPLLVVTVILGCFIAPICAIIGIILGLFERLRGY